jgi:putative nucleotidyltransferase with HDIG domain
MVVYHRGTAQHSERVGAIARALGAELMLPDAELEMLHWTGLLHDIGKLSVPEEILSKAGPLTPDEWVEVRRHPIVGAEVLRAISPGLEPVASGVRGHHERWDGSGYPDALAGRDIPLAARIVTIGDVYDALTHRRSYRPEAFPSESALEHLVANAGRFYDPEIVDAFRRVRPRSEETV